MYTYHVYDSREIVDHEEVALTDMFNSRNILK